MLSHNRSWHDSVTSIAEGVTGIATETFNYCSALKNINIPDTVTSIGESAFYKCSALTSATFKNITGWKATLRTTTKDVTVTDTSKAAKALINTYQFYTWTRSDN